MLKIQKSNHIIKKNNKFIEILKPGNIIFVQYLLLKEDEIKISNFIGLSLLIKGKSNTLLLKNNIKKEKIRLLIHLHSPLILKVQSLKKYKKKFRLNKLYFKQ